ncbi:ABC transporter ATP-binding protein [Paenibacillus sambharensis]|uniref:ABC transporter ATP-binding protein n=1 Tax=Paenibacillus sambharensis TaxID=1803190 RepID=A0A2W1LV82_9BACL|nr:ABC transporter ATP-binding protein [Paenibacillus sambharensis]PZD95691.1 ABC transporter ATP-binding protein [Paenibacillus sambharensis]
MELMRVENVTKTFGTTQAVKDISFSIGEGRCVALLGPNGAGKTTTIRMLTGLLKPTSGQIRFAGANEADAFRASIGYLPQTPPLYGWMNGLEFLVHCGRASGMTAKAATTAAKELLVRVGLEQAGKRRVGGYSGGMKQRLGLAQALIHKPRLIVLDEPVSALDPVGRREVLELLRELKRETTVLFSTHVLPDAEELCDDVIIVAAGKVAVQGALPDIRREHQQPVLELQTDGSALAMSWVDRWLAAQAGKSYVVEGTRTADGFRLVVSDVPAAQRDLLQALAEADIAVRRMEFGHTSLEDLFMKAVASQ